MNPKTPPAHVVIVGAGFGGLSTARKLHASPVKITLIDKQNHHLFQPLLYQVATAGISPADIAVPIRHIVKNQKNVTVLMTEVVGVNPQTKTIQTKSGELTYDFLVLATGAQYHYFGHPEWEKFAPSLKTIPDATAIRRRVLTGFERAEMEPDEVKRQKYLNFILVGGGPTGVEMAGALAELAHKALASDFRKINPKSARIILVEAAPRILGSFPEALSRKATQHLEQMGIEVRTNCKVESIDEKGILANGEVIASRTIVWCAGVRATPISEWVGAKTDRSGRVLVNDHLNVEPYSNVFVIGDAALVKDNKGAPLPGVAPAAMQEGQYVGKVIKSRVKSDKPLPPFRYVDKGNLATVGRSFAIADLRGLKISGVLGWLIWVFVHVFYLIGFKNRILVLFQWAWSYFTFERGARLITPIEDPLVTAQDIDEK